MLKCDCFSFKYKMSAFVTICLCRCIYYLRVDPCLRVLIFKSCCVGHQGTRMLYTCVPCPCKTVLKNKLWAEVSWTYDVWGKLFLDLSWRVFAIKSPNHTSHSWTLHAHTCKYTLCIRWRSTSIKCKEISPYEDNTTRSHLSLKLLLWWGR